MNKMENKHERKRINEVKNWFTDKIHKIHPGAKTDQGKKKGTVSGMKDITKNPRDAKNLRLLRPILCQYVFKLR